MRIKTWYIFAVLLVLAMAAGDWVYGYFRTHEPIAIPAQNRRSFAHVVVAIDCTRSMRADAVAAAKEIVTSRIIPSVGPGDRLACLAIGPRYGLSSQVFGATYEEQVPQLSPEDRKWALDVTGRVRRKPGDGIAAGEIRDLSLKISPLWPRVASAHQKWSNSVSALARPKDDGTSIRALLDGIRAEFEDRPLAHEEIWIYLVSDLLEDPPRGSRSVDEAKHTGSLAGAHIVLVYPHESEQADWSRVKAYWRGQLEGDNITIIPFSRALSDPFLLPPGPVAGLDKLDLRTGWAYMRPAVFPELIVVLILLLACLVGQRSGPMGKRNNVTWTPTEGNSQGLP